MNLFPSVNTCCPWDFAFVALNPNCSATCFALDDRDPDLHIRSQTSLKPGEQLNQFGLE